jgi:hypothetical protein
MNELFMNMTPLKTTGYLLALVNVVVVIWLHIKWWRRLRYLKSKRLPSNTRDMWVIRAAFGLTLWAPLAVLFAGVYAVTGFLIIGFGEASDSENLKWQIFLVIESVVFLLTWIGFIEVITEWIVRKRR